MSRADQFKDSLSLQFELYVGAIHAIYLSLVASVQNASLPLYSAGFRARAAILAKRTSEAIVDQVDLAFYEMSRGLPAKAKAELDVERMRFNNFVSSALVAVMVQVDQKLRLGNPQIKEVLSFDSGAMGQLIQQRQTEARYELKDTSGRTWEALKLFSVVARDFAYQTEVTAALTRAKMAGLEFVDVMTSQSPLPVQRSVSELEERRAEIFHPNSSSEIINV